MRRRAISDRELVHNLRFELEELRRGLAAVVERLEELEEPAACDAGSGVSSVTPSSRDAWREEPRFPAASSSRRRAFEVVA